LYAGLSAWAALAVATAQSPANAGGHPVPRTDANSQKAHLQLLEKARKGGIDVYFEGDSITRRWGASEAQYRDFLANWTYNFYGWNAADFGWGGDTVQNILWRLENGELDGVQPKVIVLLAGTNNLGGKPLPGGEDGQVGEVVDGIRKVLAVMRQKAPRATLILTGITPRRDRNGTSFAPAIRRINTRLAGLADGKAIRFLNLNGRLGDPEGQPLEGMTVDGLHLSLKGYQIWADALKPILTGLLGPPARTDHAPAPTGDPSAAKPAAAAAPAGKLPPQ
jgi:lysophospholipase L1-like esterase